MMAANRYLGKLWCILRSNLWLLAAFFIPLLIRAIPTMLAWPYLLGLDTLTVVPLIGSGHVLLSGPSVFIYSQLFYSFATLLNWVFNDTVFVLNILGPILMGMVALMMFLYARRGLGWSNFKSFLVALLVATFFVSLRNSWDLYAQSFALVFLFAALIVVKSVKSNWRFPLALVFTLLTVFSHQLVSVIMFFVLGLEALYLLRSSRRSSLLLILSLIPAGLFFLFRTYSPRAGAIAIPPQSVAQEPSFALGLHMVGLLVYCYILIAPLALLGLSSCKDRLLKFWAVWCVAAVLLLAFFPNLPLYYWNRWVYLLVYPLLFFAVEGLDRLWNLRIKHKIKFKPLPKVLALSYMTLILVLSGFYLTATPENQISVFSTQNPYLTYIPSSMIQNTIPIKDNPSLIACVDWINTNTSNDSVIVTHYALYDLIKIYGDGKPVIQAVPDSMWDYVQNETSIVNGMIDRSNQAVAEGHTVYTIWWINGEDAWYRVSSLPSDFRLVHQYSNMGVFLYSK
ncbi:MAG: hypothetical protein NWE93_00550 [Candidatus Bathyarchaeota archaeon]|nr:hypothetical protein [Candidatus Bathyarchaeota archaeon]